MESIVSMLYHEDKLGPAFSKPDLLSFEPGRIVMLEASLHAVVRARSAKDLSNMTASFHFHSITSTQPGMEILWSYTVVK